MMQALTAPLDETADGAFGSQGFEELQTGLADFDEAGADGLIIELDHLGVGRAEVRGEEVQGSPDVTNGDADVVDVVDGADFGHRWFASLDAWDQTGYWARTWRAMIMRWTSEVPS